MKLSSWSQSILFQGLILWTTSSASPMDWNSHPTSNHYHGEASSHGTGHWDSMSTPSNYHYMVSGGNLYHPSLNYHPNVNHNYDSQLYHDPYGVIYHGYEAGPSVSHQFQGEGNVDLNLRLGRQTEAGQSSVQHQQDPNLLDLNLRLGPGPTSYASHRSIVERQTSPLIPIPIQVQHQPPRLERLSEYEWQNEITEDQAMEVYQIIVPRWRLAGKSTNRSRLEKLNALLEKYRILVRQILAHNQETIRRVVDFTSTCTVRTKKNVSIEPLLTPTKVLESFRVPHAHLSIEFQKRAKWAPHDMSIQDQKAIVEVLHRAWITNRGSVKNKLLRMGPELIGQWASRLLNTDKAKAEKAALRMEEKWAVKSRRNRVKAQWRRYHPDDILIESDQDDEESESSAEPHHEAQEHQQDEQYHFNQWQPQHDFEHDHPGQSDPLSDTESD